MERFRRFVKLVAIALVVAAVIEQLRRDPDDRTWEGTVAGFVPYDLRMPTLARARDRGGGTPRMTGCSCRRCSGSAGP